MRLPFIPREEKFFELFVEDAQNVLAGARLLEEFFRSYDQRERIASQLAIGQRRNQFLGTHRVHYVTCPSRFTSACPTGFPARV